MAAAPAAAAPQQAERARWLEVLEKIARPVLSHMARRELRAKMPVEGKTADQPEETIPSGNGDVA